MSLKAFLGVVALLGVGVVSALPQGRGQFIRAATFAQRSADAAPLAVLVDLQNGPRDPNALRSGAPEPALILRQVHKWSPDYGYQYSYQTENQISSYQNAELRQVGTEPPYPAVSGSYSYIDENGKNVTVSYVADENGYRAQGDVLPVPPPVPVAIQRGLDFIRSQPGFREDQE